VEGSIVIVVPRASLLWKPSPALRYSSVGAVGAKMSDAFGLAIAADRRPEFSVRVARDVERVRVAAHA